MLTLAWLVVFLSGIAAILVFAVVFSLVRFLFGRSRRPDAMPLHRRRARRIFPGLARTTFVAWSVTLIASVAAVRLLLGGGSVFGCTLLGAAVECSGYVGAEGVGWWLSLPAQFGDQTNLLIVVLRDLRHYASDGLSGLPLPPQELAMGLIGPAVLILAWAGFVVLLWDVRRFWRGW